jgi:N6-adenosine-specific RNA methylase IME4
MKTLELETDAMARLAASDCSAFRCIVADPPWKVKRGPKPGGYKTENGKQVWHNTGTATEDLAYATMTVDEICSLPVRDMADKNAHLYLWTINRYIEQSYTVARAWGFEPSTMLVWAKNPLSGLGGAFTISTEYVLFCRRGTLPAKGRVTGTWWNWKRPYNAAGKPQHSAKPEAFQDMVESVSPGPYLELFARRKRHGWASWGNEIANDVEMPNAGGMAREIAAQDSDNSNDING